MRARILLKSDQSTEGLAWTDAMIAEAVEVSPQTVFDLRKKWGEMGLEHVRERRLQAQPSRMPRKKSRW